MDVIGGLRKQNIFSTTHSLAYLLLQAISNPNRSKLEPSESIYIYRTKPNQILEKLQKSIMYMKNEIKQEHKEISDDKTEEEKESRMRRMKKEQT